MRSLLTALALFGVLVVASPARAVPILDTIPGAKTSVGLTNTQFLAAEFTLDNAFTLTQIQGWIKGNDPAVLLIYKGGIFPSGDPLFEYKFTVANALAGWSGLDSSSSAQIAESSVFLDEGSYWLTFQGVSQGSLLMPTGAADALPSEAFFSTASGKWQPLGPFGLAGLGIRISGDSPAGAPVPEPDSLLLLLTSLAAIRLIQRRRT